MHGRMGNLETLWFPAGNLTYSFVPWPTVSQRDFLMRRILVLTTLSAVFLPAPLWAQDSLATQLRQCSVIVGSVERLACYDQLAHHPVPAASQLLPAPLQVPQRPMPSPPADQTVLFGADTIPQATPTPPPRSNLDSITSPVVDFSFDVRGHFTVILANGQIWRQIEGDPPNVPLRKGRTHTATISRAVLGSYSIHFDDPRGLFKVLRVR